MITDYRILNTTPGATIVASPELAHKEILEVKRTGTGYDKVNIIGLAAGGRRYVYGVSSGSFRFHSSLPFFSGETVYVLYKV